MWEKGRRKRGEKNESGKKRKITEERSVHGDEGKRK